MEQQQERRACKVLVGKPGGKRQLGMSKCEWDDNKLRQKEIGWGGANWIHLTQNKDHWRIFVNAVFKLGVP
jgi:hypothetical protein